MNYLFAVVQPAVPVWHNQLYLFDATGCTCFEHYAFYSYPDLALLIVINDELTFLTSIPYIKGPVLCSHNLQIFEVHVMPPWRVNGTTAFSVCPYNIYPP